MGEIVCATRGGAGSRAVQTKAIEQAQKAGHNLVFLYIVDTSGLDDSDKALEPAVKSELHWLGRTLLRIALARAERVHVEAEIVVRDGEVKDEICAFLRERNAESLFIGAPRGTTAAYFGDDVVEQFAQFITEQTGVEVEIVRPETSTTGAENED